MKQNELTKERLALAEKHIYQALDLIFAIIEDQLIENVATGKDAGWTSKEPEPLPEPGPEPEPGAEDPKFVEPAEPSVYQDISPPPMVAPSMAPITTPVVDSLPATAMPSSVPAPAPPAAEETAPPAAVPPAAGETAPPAAAPPAAEVPGSQIKAAVMKLSQILQDNGAHAYGLLTGLGVHSINDLEADQRILLMQMIDKELSKYKEATDA